MEKGKRIDKHFKFVDILFYITCVGICFLLFSHSDLLVTANNAMMLLEGRWKDFYTACYELGGNYNANYLISTFVVFAIWNIPFKILGSLPAYWGDWSEAFFVWNKILPSIVFIGSAYLIYKISKEILLFDSRKAKLTAWIFLTAPVAIFCQFIFSQYDIFTVFFMLLGMYYYFKADDNKKYRFLFVLFFGIATTFKYFALVYFFVLLLLKEKDIFKILLNSFYVAVPTIMCGVVYFLLDRQSFITSVLGFSVLDRAVGNGIEIGLTTLNLAVVALCIVMAWSYFTNVVNKDLWISYVLYFCAGISFAIFTFMHWHPQWMIMAIPFWTIMFMNNSKADVFIWLDLLFGVAFNILAANKYATICDENLLKNGILSSLFVIKKDAEITLSDVYVFSDVSMLYAILVAIMIIYFVFNHPSRIKEGDQKTIEEIKMIIRIRFVVYILSFIVPISIAAKSLYNMPERWWSISLDNTWGAYGDLEKKTNIISQSLTLPEGRITSVDVYLATCQNIITTSYIDLLIMDEETEEILAVDRVESTEIKDCECVTFEFNEVFLEEKKYTFVFETNMSEEEPILLFAKPDKNIHIPQRETIIKEYSKDVFKINGKIMDNIHLVMSIYGYSS